MYKWVFVIISEQQSPSSFVSLTVTKQDQDSQKEQIPLTFLGPFENPDTTLNKQNCLCTTLPLYVVNDHKPLKAKGLIGSMVIFTPPIHF